MCLSLLTDHNTSCVCVCAVCVCCVCVSIACLLGPSFISFLPIFFIDSVFLLEPRAIVLWLFAYLSIDISL